MTIPSLTPLELKAEIDAGCSPLLLDVREAEELAICVLPGVVHIPIGEVPERMTEIDPEADIVVICHVGGRSGCVTQFLRGQGYARVRNLSEGMDGWARQVDPSVQTY